jgi:hypothetical protein
MLADQPMIWLISNVSSPQSGKPLREQTYALRTAALPLNPVLDLRNASTVTPDEANNSIGYKYLASNMLCTE